MIIPLESNRNASSNRDLVFAHSAPIVSSLSSPNKRGNAEKTNAPFRSLPPCSVTVGFVRLWEELAVTRPVLIPRSGGIELFFSRATSREGSSRKTGASYWVEIRNRWAHGTLTLKWRCNFSRGALISSFSLSFNPEGAFVCSVDSRINYISCSVRQWPRWPRCVWSCCLFTFMIFLFFHCSFVD